MLFHNLVEFARPPIVSSFSRIFLDIWVFLFFHMKFRINLFSSNKNHPFGIWRGKNGYLYDVVILFPCKKKKKSLYIFSNLILCFCIFQECLKVFLYRFCRFPLSLFLSGLSFVVFEVAVLNEIFHFYFLADYCLYILKLLTVQANFIYRYLTELS